MNLNNKLFLTSIRISQNIHKIQTYHTFTRLIMDIDFDLGD